ncbi:class II aldolase/adducin family protein [Sporolactobacillus sp. STSJ-5]|uniref:class II aldolase/adducin family protein n=1 Tax=Sporolactobacillus sp. STSJ-5 TaxID=2965076 RepID=UPI0021081517|nr:class II aldolase/adducin family protein [Sporolactobacillus sp. STSJ-5]MCQ2009773.1 class II aldolase/adducin family protein [Sporolactobacillus sp. STSJ-5]
MLYESERKDLCTVVKTMFDRFETNAAGGNVSVRIDDDHIIMTPTLMSQQKLCNLNPYDILVVNMDEEIIEGDGKLTREINMHMACYKQNKKIGCVIHAHPRDSLFFATLGIELPNLTEATQKLGKIPTLDYRPATTVELADLVREHIKSLGDDVVPKACLLNSHGILITDKTLHKAYDMLERIEYNAYIAEKALIFDKLGIVPLHKEC